MNANLSGTSRRLLASALSGLMLFAPFAQAQTQVYQYQVYMPGLLSEVPAGNASPAIVDFGEVQIPGVSPWRTVTFANTGEGDLSIGEIAAPAEFELQNGCDSILAPKQSCDMYVRFAPAVGGVTSGRLSVASNAFNSPDLVALTGVGTLPVATFSANPVNLGSVEVGTPSATTQLSISNTGTGVLSVSNLAFGGSEHGFSVTEGSCTPLPKSLGNQESCALDVRVTPNATGLLAGLVNVTTNDAIGGYGIPLQVTGIQAGLVLSPGALAFGDVPTDVQSAHQSITVTNDGTAALNIASVSRVGSDVDQFSNPTASNTCGEAVAPGASCTISVAALPTAGGAKTANLEIISNAPSSPTLAGLSVNGVLPGLVTTDLGGTALSSVAFGNVPVDETTQASPSQVIVVKNPSVSELKDLEVAFGGTNSDQFSYSTTCGASVLAGASCSINLTANPSTDGAKSAAVTITAKADNSPVTIPVTASATVPTAEVSPASLNLAPVKVGFASSATVTVSNSGAAPLKITSVALSGADVADFTQTNNCPTQLAANGGTCTVTVSGTPGAAGLRSTTLVVSSNDSESPANVPVSITGLSPMMSVDTSAGSASPVSAEYNMGSAVVGTRTAAIPFYVKNTSSVVLAGLQVGTTGALAADTTLANNCGASLAAGASCMFSLAVEPTSTGVRTGVVTVEADAANSPISFNYSITGVQPALTFRNTGDTANVASVSYATTRVGTTAAAQSFKVKNTGTSTMTVSSVTLTGANAAEFTRSHDCAAVAAGASCTVNVAFAPTSTGSKTAAITVADDAPGSPHSVTLAGTGGVSTVATQNASNVAITTLAFGNVDVMVTSANQELRVKNTGALPLNVTSVALSGTNAADFQIASNGCTTSVAAGAYCSVMLNAKPTTSGSKSATATVTSDASNSPSSLTLSATGTEAVATFRNSGDTAAYTGASFGTIKVGATSSAQSFLLKNTGNKTMSITSVALTGTNTGDFSLSHACGATLAVNGTCTITVNSVPTSSGSKSASVTVTSNDRSGTDSVAFTATGAEPVLAFQNSGGTVIASAALGSIQVGSSANTAVYLKNTGAVPMNVQSVRISGTNASEFSQTNTCTSAVAAGASCVVTVTSTPTNAGDNTASLAISSDAPSYSHSLPLTSTGTQATIAFRNSADTAAAASPTAFGNVVVGATSAATSVLVKNTGTAPASITSVALTGASPAEFGLSHNCPASLAVNSTCTATLTGKPTTTGARAASLTVGSNATNGTASLALTETGVQPALTFRNTGDTANVASVSYATTRVGTTAAAQSFKVKNTGTSTMTVSSVTLTGANAAEFTRSHDCTTVAAGSSCTVTVAFAPTSTGSKTAAITVTDNAPGSPHSVTLSGTGAVSTVAMQNASNVAITTLAFGNVDVMVTSANQELRVKNTGALPLNVTSVALSGTNAADFQIASNGCTTSVAAGAYCSVMLNAKPTTSGSKSATVTVTSDASNSPTSITLSATGTEAVATFRNSGDTAAYTGASFGTIKVGATSSAQSFLLKNTGNKTMSITSVAMTGTHAGDFSLTNGCGATLAAGATCSLAVSAAPTSAGGKSASVTVTSNDRSGTDSVAFTATGAEPVLSFQNSGGTVITSGAVGSIQVGSSANTGVYLKNTGSVPMNVYTVGISGTNASEFLQTNTCTSAVAAGASCVVTVSSTPANAGANTASLNISSDAPSYSHSLPLTSTGIQATLAYRNSADTAAVTSLAFSNVLVGSTSAAQTILVKNTGTATASNFVRALSGTNAADFAVSTTTCGTTLAAGATCSVSLTAKPTATGARAGSLVTTSNATNPSMSLALSVTGTQPAIALRNTANTANVTSLAFAAQLVGTTSAAQQYRVYNTGTAAATGFSVTESGTNSDQFTTSSDCGTSLANGTYCTVTVAYAPTVKAASHSTSARVNSSAPSSPHAVALSGSSTQGTVTVTVDGVTNPTTVNFGTVVVN